MTEAEIEKLRDAFYAARRVAAAAASEAAWGAYQKAMKEKGGKP